MAIQIDSPEITKTLDDYDITFESGIVMPLTIDKEAGDTITFPTASTIQVNLTTKPSVNDPSRMLPAEEVTIFVQHVISIQKRSRVVTELSPAQKAEWAKVIQEMSQAIN